MQDKIDKEKIFSKVLGKIVKNHRVSQQKSIYQISAEASIPKSTWREVEIAACKNVYISTLWKIAEGLDISPVKLIEELKNELGDNFSFSE